MKNNKGFSLVELMVVVAIIGILASMALPNFQKFMGQTRQAEAKTKLNNLLAAEKAFHAEWNFYYGDFQNIGYELEGEGRYQIGFTGRGGPAAKPAGFIEANGPFTTVGELTVAPGASAWSPKAFLIPNAVPLTITVAANGNCLAQAPPSVNFGQTATFVAGSRGIPYSEVNIDGWTIDQNKLLCNNEPGIR